MNKNIKKRDLYILTGFLGSGKTSFLMHILDNLGDRKIGVIQNEFGKLNIDGEIIERNGIEMTEISRGSIFCSCLKLSFVQALAEMGKMDLDLVLVESSGLADPSNLGEIFDAVSELAGDVYTLKGVICLIDGVNFLEQLSDVETVDRQLAHCHMAIINKLDLIDEEQLSKVKEAVRKVNPLCDVLTATNGEVTLDFLEKDLTLNQLKEWEATTNLVENKPKTISLETLEIIPQEVLEKFLQSVLPDCYRIKGFCHLDSGWQQVDVVEKLIHFKPSEPRDLSQLVFLSKIGPQVIRTVHNAWQSDVKLPMNLRN